MTVRTFDPPMQPGHVRFKDLPEGAPFKMTDVAGRPGYMQWVKYGTGAVGRYFDRSQAVHPEAEVEPAP